MPRFRLLPVLVLFGLLLGAGTAQGAVGVTVTYRAV